MKRLVSVVRCSSYNPSELLAALRAAMFFAGDLLSRIEKGNKVLLKPNLLSKAPPERAVTTHPEFLRAMIKLVKQVGGEPVVGDSPGGLNTPERIKAMWKESGMLDVCEEEGVEIKSFEKDVREMRIDGKILKSLVVPQAFLEADLMITLPKLKTHGLVGLTGAVKINFGLVPGLLKASYHMRSPKTEDFADILLDIFLATKPAFAVADAIVAMQGEGPSSGRPYDLGLVLASDDPVAIDLVAARILGFDIWDVPTNRAARSRGLIEDIEEVEVRGEKLDGLTASDFEKPIVASLVEKMPRWLWKFGQNVVVPKPAASPELCDLCQTCLKNCPAKAIYVEDKRILIDYDMCIRCYCCQELCPRGAMKIRPNFVSRLFLGGKRQ